MPYPTVRDPASTILDAELAERPLPPAERRLDLQALFKSLATGYGLEPGKQAHLGVTQERLSRQRIGFMQRTGDIQRQAQEQLGRNLTAVELNQIFSGERSLESILAFHFLPDVERLKETLATSLEGQGPLTGGGLGPLAGSMGRMVEGAAAGVTEQLIQHLGFPVTRTQKMDQPRTSMEMLGRKVGGLAGGELMRVIAPENPLDAALSALMVPGVPGLAVRGGQAVVKTIRAGTTQGVKALRPVATRLLASEAHAFSPGSAFGPRGAGLPPPGGSIPLPGQGRQFSRADIIAAITTKTDLPPNILKARSTWLATASGKRYLDFIESGLVRTPAESLEFQKLTTTFLERGLTKKEIKALRSERAADKRADDAAERLEDQVEGGLAPTAPVTPAGVTPAPVVEGIVVSPELRRLILTGSDDTLALQLEQSAKQATKRNPVESERAFHQEVVKAIKEEQARRKLGGVEAPLAAPVTPAASDVVRADLARKLEIRDTLRRAALTKWLPSKEVWTAEMAHGERTILSDVADSIENYLRMLRDPFYQKGRTSVGAGWEEDLRILVGAPLRLSPEDVVLAIKRLEALKPQVQQALKRVPAAGKPKAGAQVVEAPPTAPVTPSAAARLPTDPIRPGSAFGPRGVGPLESPIVSGREQFAPPGSIARGVTGEGAAAPIVGGRETFLPRRKPDVYIPEGRQLTPGEAIRLPVGEARRPSLQAGPLGDPSDILPPATSLPQATGHKFVGSLKDDFGSIVDEVVTVQNPILRNTVAKLGLNPSAAATSEVDKAIVAFARQSVASENLTAVALGGGLDAHATRFTARLGKALPLTNGVVKGTGKRWEDVFSRPQAYNLTDETRAYANDYLQIIREAEEMRVVAGLKPRGINKDGWFYVPRQVKATRGVELTRPSNPNLQLVFEEATDGARHGVRYSNDPRANLEIHLRASFREVATKQLSDFLEVRSITPKALIPEVIVEARRGTALQRLFAERQARQRIVQELRSQNRAIMPSTFANRVSADPLVIQARKAHLQAKAAYTKALERARRAEVAPGQLFGRREENIPVAMWRNRFFPREDADALINALGQFGSVKVKENPWLAPVRILANHIRFLSAVGDFAAPFIQGLPLLASNPVSWGKATLRHYQAWFNPRVQSRLIRDNLEDFQAMAREGIPIGDPEFFAALRPGEGISAGALLELLPKGAELRRLARLGGRQTFGRFQASYNTFLSSARLYLWKGAKGGWKDTDAELAAYIRNMTGGLDSKALGVSPNQRAVESAWLAFSPRLFRSTTALIFDAVRPWTPRGRKSLRALSQLMTGATGLYVTSGLALGKSWEEIKEGLNPLNGKQFLSHQIGGQWYGIGGQVRGITQLMAGLYSAIDNPGKLIDSDPFENPLLAFYMSRGAVGYNIVGGSVEALSGGRLNPLPFDNIDSLPDLVSHIGMSSLPFALQGLLEGDSVPGIVAGLLGARTSPETIYEKRNAIREQISTSLFSISYDDLAVDQKEAVNNSPEVMESQIAVEALNLERGNAYTLYQQDRDTEITKTEVLISQAAEQLLPSDFRRRSDELRAELSIRLENIRETHSDALEFIKDLDPSTQAFDIALGEWIELISDRSLTNSVTGDYNFTERSLREQELVTKHGQEIIQRVQNYLSRNKGPMELEKEAGRDYLQEYWRVGETITPRVPEGRLRDRWEEYLSSTSQTRRTQILVENPILKVFVSQVTQARRLLAVQDPLIDAFRVKWYGRVSVLNRGREGLNRLIEQHMLSLTPPALPGVQRLNLQERVATLATP